LTGLLIYRQPDISLAGKVKALKIQGRVDAKDRLGPNAAVLGIFDRSAATDGKAAYIIGHFAQIMFAPHIFDDPLQRRLRGSVYPKGHHAVLQSRDDGQQAMLGRDSWKVCLLQSHFRTLAKSRQ